MENFIKVTLHSVTNDERQWKMTFLEDKHMTHESANQNLLSWDQPGWQKLREGSLPKSVELDENVKP